MQTLLKSAKSILTAQSTGFLASAPFPFTHTLSPFTGCGYGKTSCGLYCYAQYMPNWLYNNAGATWGSLVEIKENAADVLGNTLAAMSSFERRKLRIFMSSITDPYQPVEVKHQITRSCLEVFAQYQDLDLLVIQTRSPLVIRDFNILQTIPYAWISVTIETDDQAVVRAMGGGPPLKKRFDILRLANQYNIKKQIAVSPCLPYTDNFVGLLLDAKAERIIVDNCVDGDGAAGKRTARSPYALHNAKWNDTAPSISLFQQLKAQNIDVSWSASGFCGIPPR